MQAGIKCVSWILNNRIIKRVNICLDKERGISAQTHVCPGWHRPYLFTLLSLSNVLWTFGQLFAFKQRLRNIMIVMDFVHYSTKIFITYPESISSSFIRSHVWVCMCVKLYRWCNFIYNVFRFENVSWIHLIMFQKVCVLNVSYIGFESK